MPVYLSCSPSTLYIFLTPLPFLSFLPSNPLNLLFFLHCIFLSPHPAYLSFASLPCVSFFLHHPKYLSFPSTLCSFLSRLLYVSFFLLPTCVSFSPPILCIFLSPPPCIFFFFPLPLCTFFSSNTLTLFIFFLFFYPFYFLFLLSETVHSKFIHCHSMSI